MTNSKQASKPKLTLPSRTPAYAPDVLVTFVRQIMSCIYCGDLFIAKRSAARFCSKYCIDKNRSETKRRIPCAGCGALGYWGQKKDNPDRCRDCINLPMSRAYALNDPETLLNAIKSRVEVHPQTNCWEWRAGRHGDGYGMFYVADESRAKGKRGILAHRAAVEAATGKVIPSHMPVHHECANRICCNPDHLRVVSPEENLAEMMERNFYLSRISALEDVVADQQKQIIELTARLAELTERSDSL